MTKRRSKPRPLIALVSSALVALLVLAVAACTGGETPPAAQPTTEVAPPTPSTGGTEPTATGGTEPTATTATAEPAEQPTAAPEPVPSGDLPQPTEPAGTVAVAQQNIVPGTGLGSAQAPVELLHQTGVGEAPFTCTEEGRLAEKLITAWEVTPEGGTLTVREGVVFHKDMGPLTAADVAWSMNDANGGTHPTSIHGQAGDFAALFGSNEWQAPDERTVTFQWQTYDVTALTGFLSDCTQSLVVFSKKAYDEMGEDFVRQNIIGTGPLQVVSWTENQEAVMEPVPYEHWEHNAQFDQLRILEVPEENTRVALLETGGLGGSLELSIQSILQLQDAGFQTASAGLAEQWGVFMLGNYWEETNAITGEPLNITQSGVYVNDLPWQGNPFSPADNNNPQGMDDMEQARLVRTALALAINRQEINEVLVGGLGYPVSNPYYDPNHSRWKPEWNYEYNPEMAMELLAQAGYEGGGYEQPLYVRPENATSVEIAEAIGGYWQAIGLDSPIISYAYAAFRPSVVGRTQTVPWLSTCDEGSNGIPWDWPKGKVMSSITRGGFSCGQEIPFIAEKYLEAAVESDPAAREAINDEVLEYMQHWALNPGVVSIPILAVINPNAIESWEQHRMIRGGITDWDMIVPAGR